MRCQALLKLLEQALLTASCLLQELLFALLEIFASAQRRNVLFEPGEEFFHRLLERLALASLYGERTWAFRMFEGKDVA